MPFRKEKLPELMIPLRRVCPHIPYWFTLRRAMAIVREAAIKFERTFEPRSMLVFDEKYHLLGILTLFSSGISSGGLAPKSRPRGCRQIASRL